jgi:uncharacterized protein (DUF2147 family)
MKFNLPSLLRPAGLAIATLLTLAAASAFAAEPSPVGRWRTFDHKTGADSGLIEITQSGGELVGKIVKIVPRPGDPVDPVCKKCDGPEKNQRVLGMTILEVFKRDGEEWDGGTILDPRSGYVYSSELRIDDGGRKLLVRGYIGISLLGRTETWLRGE